MFKSTIVSSAVALLAGAASMQASAVQIDIAGGGGSGTTNFGSSAVYNVDSLDWSPDNALTIGALSTPVGGTVAGQGANESYLRTVAQGRLANFGVTGGTVAPQVAPGVFLTSVHEYTFQASFYEFSSGIGTSTSSFRLAPGASVFNIYADTNADSNQVTGAGYGNGTLILSGTLASLSGAYTDKTRTVGDPSFGQTPLLDNGPDNTDDQHGVLTHVGQGSNSIDVKVTYLNSNYFLGNISDLLLTLMYSDTTNLNDPFITAEPSNQVFGVTPSYSVVGAQKINGGDCTAGGQTELGVATSNCDFHFQSDASGRFVTTSVPEPGSLALVGLALCGAGVFVRRKA